MVQFIKATDEYIIQHRVFKPLNCSTPIFKEIKTLSMYNNEKDNLLECTFLNEDNEVVKRPLKLKKIHRKPVIHITYKNQMYVLMAVNYHTK